MKTKKNIKLSVEDLICNESFQRWTYDKKGPDEAHWKSFVSRHPEAFEIIEDARVILVALRQKGADAPPAVKNSVWKSIEACRKKNIRMRFVWSAAACLFLAALFVIGWQGSRRSGYNKFYSSLVEHTDAMDSGEIRLILSNDKQLEATGDQPTILFGEKGEAVQINEELVSLSEKEKKEMNQVIVPFGKRSNLKLEDGTLVFLNAGSKLIFPSHFSKQKREVFLVGEAYFEVARNPEVPFYVITSEHKVKVTGTRFDVKAYNNTPFVSTVLIEGEVVLQTENSLGFVSGEVVLKPNQRAIFSKERKQFRVKDEPDAINSVSWKDGWMYFSRQPLVGILAQIERYYNVKFDIDNVRFDRGRISGKLDLKDSLADVLNVISRLSKVSFREQDGKICVIKRG